MFYVGENYKYYFDMTHRTYQYKRYVGLDTSTVGKLLSGTSSVLLLNL